MPLYIIARLIEAAASLYIGSVISIPVFFTARSIDIDEYETFTEARLLRRRDEKPKRKRGTNAREITGKTDSLNIDTRRKQAADANNACYSCPRPRCVFPLHFKFGRANRRERER